MGSQHFWENNISGRATFLVGQYLTFKSFGGNFIGVSKLLRVQHFRGVKFYIWSTFLGVKNFSWSNIFGKKSFFVSNFFGHSAFFLSQLFGGQTFCCVNIWLSPPTHSQASAGVRKKFSIGGIFSSLRRFSCHDFHKYIYPLICAILKAK